jgi:hypothetical protein
MILVRSARYCVLCGFLYGFSYETWAEGEGRQYPEPIQNRRQCLPLSKTLCEVVSGFIYLLNPLHTLSLSPAVFKHSDFVCTSTTPPYLPPLFCFTTRITDSRPCLRNLSPEIRFAHISFRHVVFLTIYSLLLSLFPHLTQLSWRYCPQISYKLVVQFAYAEHCCTHVKWVPCHHGKT